MSGLLQKAISSEVPSLDGLLMNKNNIVTDVNCLGSWVAVCSCLGP